MQQRFFEKLIVWIIFGILLLSGCSGPDQPLDPAASSSFSFFGTDTLPAGFDAQGHRGARGLLPENTLPAVEAALDLGVTTLELDLHYTQDGVVVVWHDPIIDNEKCRLPDPDNGEVPDPRNPLRKILVSQQPLNVVQAYQCDLNPDPNRFPDQEPLSMPLSGQNYAIPTLQEVIDFVAAYAQSDQKTAVQRANAAAVQFNLETKRKVDHPEYIDDGFTGGQTGPFEDAILDIVAANELADRVVIQSFDHRSLQTIRAVDPDLRLAALTTAGEAKIKVYNGYKFDIWSPNARDLTAERLAEAHELGLLVIPWTVNDPAEMSRLIELGVDGIITDRPDLLLNLE